MTKTPPDLAERRFLFRLALAMVLVNTAGFATNLAMHRSTFAVPALFHIHALVFFGWMALVVVQTGLAARGNFALHRRLGWLAALWTPAMVLAGPLLSVASLRRSGGPFFFAPAEFLFGGVSGIIVFALLVGLALALRRQGDWHRRLMLCAMADITGPGWGRLMPMPLLIPYAWQAGQLAGLVFPLVGMLGDWRRNGRVHPAWLVGAALLATGTVAGELVAATPWADGVTRQIMAGHPGANRPMTPYLP